MPSKTSRNPSLDHGRPDSPLSLSSDRSRVGEAAPSSHSAKRQYEDWLICMISSQLGQEIPGFDEIITPDDPDFKDSGLKVTSLIRISRLAVVDAGVLLGQIGRLDDTRLARIKQKLSKWIQST